MSRSRWSPLGAALALVGLSVAVLLLSSRLRDLAAAYDRLRQHAALPHRGFLLPTFVARTVTGDSVLIGGPNARQLVFVLTAACPYCRATLPLWRTLADSARRLPGRPVQVVALSLDSLPRARVYAADEHLTFPVAVFPSTKARRLSRAGRVPQTLVVDDDGLVLYAHVGVLTLMAVDSVYRALTWQRPQAPDAVAAAGSRAAPSPAEPMDP